PFYCLLFYCFLDHQHLHSFPTRRSSDLGVMSPSTLANLIAPRIGARHMLGFFLMIGPQSFSSSAIIKSLNAAVAVCEDFSVFGRSEEHTSELQSRVDLVCRLLLEKKKHI